jgi:hypothetical protein
MSKQTVKQVALSVKPGDYTNIRRNKKLAMAVSSDFSEFMRIASTPSQFYVIAKHYFTERTGLYKCLPGKNNIESAIHATMISLLTQLVGNIERNVLDDDDDDDDYQNNIKGAIKELKQALKSEERMRQFDELCTSRYGIESEIAKGVLKEDEVEIDNHLDAKS